MAGQNEETLDTQVEQVPIDDWAAAFAALDKEDEKNPDTDTDTDGEANDEEDNVPDTEKPDEGEDSVEDEGNDSMGSEVSAGGSGDLGGTDDQENASLDWDDIDISEEGIKEYKESLMEDIRERAIADVANAYIKQGARNVNGRLGATINDSDICKRDRDGVPRFYNPETGREFTGDNPRRQAQEWVDDYNRELADAFNKTCSDYSQKLLQEEGARLAVIEFAPKYKELDPIRRSMLDSIIEDYEKLDENGKIIGYTCDLDKALGAVNRQVQAIQKRYSHHNITKEDNKKPSGPALDTPSSGTTQQKNGKPQFKSIEEAMEWEQDQILAKMQKKGNK